MTGTRPRSRAPNRPKNPWPFRLGLAGAVFALAGLVSIYSVVLTGSRAARSPAARSSVPAAAPATRYLDASVETVLRAELLRSLSTDPEGERERAPEDSGADRLLTLPHDSGQPVLRSAASTRRSTLTKPVRWQKPGLCVDDSESRRNGLRARLARFERVQTPWGAPLLVDPAVKLATRELAIRALEPMPARMQAFLGLEATVPATYLYQSAEQLREFACVNERTVAYYDGAIHAAAAGSSDLLVSLHHEFTHHTLMTHGVHFPVWFQEGAALVFARESWKNYRFDGDIVPLETMVSAFPHGISPEQAEAFYLQAYAMMKLLADLWRGGGAWTQPLLGVFDAQRARDNVTSERDLALALLTGKASPETLFSWAVVQRTANLRPSPERLLERYIANRFVLDASVTLR
jgi:hypothetical protein